MFGIKKIFRSLLTVFLIGTSSLQAAAYTINGDANVLGNVIVPTTHKIALNAGSTTYMKEFSANDISFTANTNPIFFIKPGLVGIQTNYKFYFDVSSSGTEGDTYQSESSANQLDTVAGGALVSSAETTQFYVRQDLWIDSGKKFSLDSGTNDYWTNSADGQNDLYSANTLTIRTKSTGEVLLPAVNPPTAKYMNQNSTVKGYVNFIGSGANGAKTINGSYNVSGVTKNGTGDYTISWDTDFANSNYTVEVIAQVNPVGVPLIPTVISLATGTARVTLQTAAGTQADPADNVYVTGYGIQ